MEKESIKMFFESQSTPPDSEKIEQWYIDNINNTELDTILLELLKKCTHQDEQKARCAFSRTCHRIGIGSPKVTQKRKIIYRWISGIAATVLVCGFLLGTHLWNSRSGDINLEKVYASAGNSKMVILPDSTKVYLKPTSTLFYEANDFTHNRKVHLFGEAYVEVTKDAKHPFSVVCNNATIKVLGTKFNVHAYAEDEKTTTTLESGSVVVQKANNEDIITLTPNEQLEYDNPSGEFNKKIIDASVYSGWTRGELNFAAMTLSDIFITIERIYDIHIIVPPHLATTDVYTIKFKQKAPIKEIMNIVTKTIGNIDYKVEDENILLIYSPLNKKGGR